MHIKKIMSSLLLLALVSSLPCPASARESLVPFEDTATHLWGYRDSVGTVIIPSRFSVAEEFSSFGIAAVADESGWMIIDAKGNPLIRPFIFDNGPDPFQEGLARFKKAGKFGFFDERGRVIIVARFDFTAPFSDGLAAFCLGCREKKEGEHSSMEGGTWGFINKKGVVVIPPRFEKAGSFEQGKADVVLDGRSIVIDKKGDPLP